jgi:predicted nucleic acid-binding protein
MLIDANIFLEVLLGQKKSKECMKVLEEIKNGKEAYISTFTIDAIILVLHKHRTPLFKIALFINSLLNYEGLIIYSVSMRDRLTAVKLMGKYAIDYEDAITAQSAISAGCKFVLSMDSHFDKLKEIKRISP